MFEQRYMTQANFHSLETVLHELGIGTWEWDLSTDRVIWSESMSQFFGSPPANEKITTTRGNCLSKIHKDDIAVVEQSFKECISDKRNLKIEYRLIWPDNSIHWVQNRGCVVCSDNGIPEKLVGVMFDITQRKQMEIALNEAKEMAAMQNSAKSEFLTSMSHEMRTSLNSIIGFSQLIVQDDNLNDEQVDSVECIHKAGLHLTGLVDEIIDLAKIEAGKVQLNLEAIQVKQILAECIDLIGVTVVENGQNLTIDIEECEDWYIYTDTKRFIQVMLNLLSNAIKYNKPSGDIQILCDHVRDYVQIGVRDTGTGMSDEQLSRLFQPFERLGAEKTKIDGSGIGLVITKQLVELMGGQIEVESRVGEGSTFWVKLPCASFNLK